MRKEKLIIQNFGPIKSVDLDLGKVTVLIGEQATGKSTIAKVLAVCRYFSYIVNYSFINANEEKRFKYNKQFLKGLKDWGIYEFLQVNSFIKYESNLYSFEFKNKIRKKGVYINDVSHDEEYNSFETKISSNSQVFTDLVNQLSDLKNDTLEVSTVEDIADKFIEWTPNENFFRLNVKKVMNNPLFIPAERGFQSVSVGKDSLLSNAILDELAKINRIVKTYITDIEIKPLDIIYRNEHGLGKVKKTTDKNFHFLHNGASGYQSTIPVYLAVKYNNDIKINRGRTIIVEEPELNLFPKSQKKIVEFFIESINKFNNQFLIPTHSPYILTTLSNLIYAYKLGTVENGIYEKEVDKIIPKDSWIDVSDISVYCLKEGTASDMVDVEDCSINLDELDDVSEAINKEFEELLEIEMSKV